MPGFSIVRSEREAEGFDADLCRAVAVAIFGAPDRARFAPIDTLVEFMAAPAIDVVFHGLTWNLSRDVATTVRFGPVTFYDGQTFLVRDGRPLVGATVCVEINGRFAGNLGAYAAERQIEINALPFPDWQTARTAFAAGSCDALTGDASALFGAATRNTEILPDRFSKEPLAPVVRVADEQLLAVLRWTIFALIMAEEDGLTAQNVDQRGGGTAGFADSPLARALGLAPDWPIAVVKAAGNYGEIYRRHFLRPDQPMLARGQNELWLNGGLHYAPPLR